MEELELQKEKFNLMLDKYIKKDKINHAYLIETNSSNRIELANELVNRISALSNEDETNLNLNSDLKIIKENGQTIKKETILELKESFMTKSIYNKNRIYIIEEAEKLNDSAANTLLKFLEEPEYGIIAILITSNRNQVINTIVSRCQILRCMFISGQAEMFDEEFSKKIFDFTFLLEEKKEEAIAYLNDYYNDYLVDRNEVEKFLKALLYLYSDVLHYNLNLELEYFYKYKENIKKISSYNNLEDLKNKINAIKICIERENFNVNIKLLLDKLIILMSGVDLDVWSNRNKFY